MMGRQTGDQGQLFYLFSLGRRDPGGPFVAADRYGRDADTG